MPIVRPQHLLVNQPQCSVFREDNREFRIAAHDLCVDSFWPCQSLPPKRQTACRHSNFGGKVIVHVVFLA